MFKYPLIALGLFAGGAALAQAPPAPQVSVRTDVQKTVDSNFNKGDANNDGFLNRAEIQSMTGKATAQLQARMEQEFANLDKDKNGQISLAEFKAAATARVVPNPEVTLQKFDTNKDGKVSPAEFRAPVMTAFDRADANKDGRVTAEEAKKATGR